MRIEPWDEVSEGVPDRRRLFTVRSDVVRSRLTGREHTVDRLIAPDWVNVVAITETIRARMRASSEPRCRIRRS